MGCCRVSSATDIAVLVLVSVVVVLVVVVVVAVTAAAAAAVSLVGLSSALFLSSRTVCFARGPLDVKVCTTQARRPDNFSRSWILRELHLANPEL